MFDGVVNGLDLLIGIVVAALWIYFADIEEEAQDDGNHPKAHRNYNKSIISQLGVGAHGIDRNGHH